MEQIIITDGYTLNPGDLSWSAFESLGKVEVHDRLTEEEARKRCGEMTIIITNKTPIRESLIKGCPDLKLIAVTATGYNVVDVVAAKERGIAVVNVPAYGTDSVAQHTFSLLLELTNHVGTNEQSVRKGDWSNAPDWCFTSSPIVELSGKTMGIVGYGRIGKKVADIARAIGMNVIFNNRSAVPGSVALDDLFQNADIVSLHCPLTSENTRFVNSRLLSLMKPSAYLINTSRGQLIDESDLAAALRAGRIAGAALDVLSEEPPKKDHPLIGLLNCIVTPHNAWLSFEARKRIMEATFQNVDAFLKGRNLNRVC